jgi:hypothetical protein
MKKEPRPIAMTPFTNSVAGVLYEVQKMSGVWEPEVVTVRFVTRGTVLMPVGAVDAA